MMADRATPMRRAQNNGLSGTLAPSTFMLRLASNLSNA